MNGGDIGAIDEMNHQIDTWGPDVVMMQEVCWQQRLAFIVQHPGWGVSYVPMREEHPDCGGPQGQLLASPHPFTPLPNVPLHDDDGDKKVTLLCAMIDLPVGPTKACTVHLRAGATTEDYAARERQATRIRKALADDIAAGTKVVIGGDFNARINRDAISNLYRLTTDHTFTGIGQFFEADQTDSGNDCGSSHGACRDGQGTLKTSIGPRKFDYIFFANNLTYGYPKWLSGGVIHSDTSDHDLFRGWAYMKRTSYGGGLLGLLG